LSDAGEDQRLIDPSNAGRALSRGRWLILAAAVIGALLGYHFVKYEVGSSATYSSSTDFRVIPVRAELEFARDALGGSSAEQTRALIRTVKELITSDDVLNAALADLPEAPTRQDVGLREGCSTSDLINDICAAVTIAGPGAGGSGIGLDVYRNAIAIDQIDGSFVLRLTVSLPNRDLAADLANGLIDAYNEAVESLDGATYARISDAYEQQLADLKAQYSMQLDRELELRREIGAFALEADVDRLQNQLEAQSAALNEDEIALTATRESLAALEQATASGQPAATGPAAPGGAEDDLRTPVSLGAVRLPTQREVLSAEIEQLTAQIEERRQLLETLESTMSETARKQILLRPTIAEQATIRDSIDELTKARLDASRINMANGARAVILRQSLVATRVDPPTPVQAALIGGAGGVILVASLLLLTSVVSNAPARTTGATKPRKVEGREGEAFVLKKPDLSERLRPARSSPDATPNRASAPSENSRGRPR